MYNGGRKKKYYRRSGYATKKASYKGRTLPFKRTKYAPARPYNDDPYTPFCKYPTGTNRNEFYCKQSINVEIDVGDTTAAYSFFINYPTYYVNPSATIGQGSVISHNFTDLLNVFDQYTVTTLHIKYVPAYVNTSNPAAAGQLAIYYTNRDMDDSTLIASSDNALNGAGTKTHWFYQPKTHKAFPQNKAWYSTANGVPSTSTALTQVTTNVPLSQECIKFYFPGIINGSNMGNLIAEWYIRWRGLTPNS